MIGDAEHLRAMSGYAQKSGVARWCRKHGIRFFRDKDGWPTTTPAALDRALLPGIESGPDWSPYIAQKAPATKSSRKGRAVLLGRQEQMDGA